ncbi:DUF3667 domain-containing protein [Brevundimonas bacteroides]|uniref:DUF3667 domain-containing protein n=1 Tax=Brevundimonas bacteroides TaxID=74311 RepID=UPI0009FFA6DA|nr:DUF3667 domain-containing protein [Brevundimonas bacteroides]
MSRPAEPIPACAACGEELLGRFCHACGQDTRIRSRPLRALLSEAFSEFSLVDGKLARTISVLAVRPGHLLQAYRDGASSLYVTPLKLFVASTALFLSVMNFSSTTLYQYTWKVDEPGQPLTVLYDPDDYDVRIDGATEQDRWLQPHVEPSIDPQVAAALEAAAAATTDPLEREAIRYEIVANAEEARMTDRLSAWLPNVLWLLLPLYALGLVPLFGRSGLLLDHIVFAMWAHAVAFLMAMGMAALNGRGANLNGALLTVPYLGYFTIAAAHYYAMPLWQAFWRGLVHLACYVGLILIPTAFIIYMTVMDWNAFWTWMMA